MSTTIWYQGKSRQFDDEDEAVAWMKEIDMAKAQKRAPRYPKAPPPVDRKDPPAEIKVSVPAACKHCGVTTGQNNTGGFYVTHRSRGGNLISGSFRPGEDPTAWLERVHGEET